MYQRISVLSCFTVASAKPAVSDFRGGPSIPRTNGPGGCDAFVKMPSVFVCLTAMCIIITNLESSAKMLSFNEVEGGPLVSRGDCLYRAWTVRGDRLFRDRRSGGTIYSQHKRSGGTNSGGRGGPVSSITPTKSVIRAAIDSRSSTNNYI